MKLVTLSSTESEYVAVCEATRELKHFNYLLESIGFVVDKPSIIYEDNKSCITMLHSEFLNHNTTKHVNPKFNFVREDIAEGNIEITYMPSEEQVADLLTKALSSKQHEYLTDKLLNRNNINFDEE